MKKWALLSVTDKSGLAEFAAGLVKHGYSLLSTGGTAKLLRSNGLEVTDVDAFTASPEVMDGRVKTLHPKIYGGLLCDRNNPKHLQDLTRINGELIDLVIVNLYDFANDALAKKLPLHEAIESVDIGGPSMLRAAAKNYQSCCVIIDPADYPSVLSELNRTNSISLSTKTALAAKVFSSVSSYDSMIANYFAGQSDGAPIKLNLNKVQDLRYGENPHQAASFYKSTGENGGLVDAKILQGKELSYNNYLDLDAAVGLCSELSPTPSVVIVKHTNPCGVASFDGALSNVYSKALACDPVSAFGGIIAFNQEVDAVTAQLMSEIFLECIAAPSFNSEAISILAAKKNLRLLTLDIEAYAKKPQQQLRTLMHGTLVQSADTGNAPASAWKQASKQGATPAYLKDLGLAMTVAKHLKSNAIVLASSGATIGIGGGQMSRIDALDIAIKKAKQFKHDLTTAVLASDAFFPFRDCVDTAAKHGVKAVIQPGGSIKDQESVDACNENGICMMITGERHFRH